MKNVLWILALVLGLAIASEAFAGRHRGDGSRPPCGPFGAACLCVMPRTPACMAALPAMPPPVASCDVTITIREPGPPAKPGPARKGSHRRGGEYRLPAFP